jgi:hypothetical protein
MYCIRDWLRFVVTNCSLQASIGSRHMRRSGNSQPWRDSSPGATVPPGILRMLQNLWNAGQKGGKPSGGGKTQGGKPAGGGKTQGGKPSGGGKGASINTQHSIGGLVDRGTFSDHPASSWGKGPSSRAPHVPGVPGVPGVAGVTDVPDPTNAPVLECCRLPNAGFCPVCYLREAEVLLQAQRLARQKVLCANSTGYCLVCQGLVDPTDGKGGPHYHFCEGTLPWHPSEFKDGCGWHPPPPGMTWHDINGLCEQYWKYRPYHPQPKLELDFRFSSPSKSPSRSQSRKQSRSRSRRQCRSGARSPYIM